MKAYQVTENGKPLEEKNVETPLPKGSEVLIKTIACGVCHSDVHIHLSLIHISEPTRR